MPVTETTGKLVKASGATLVTYRIEGGYLAQPRWASNRRKGTIYGHPAGVYSPEMLAAMSEAEIDDTITRDLHFDIWDWQKSRPEGPAKYICAKGGSAEGLEKAVCSCPECGRIGELYSRGSEAGCSCGFKVRFDETGMFEPARPFETIVDWEKHDFKVLSAYLDPAQNDALRDPSAVPELLGDDGATLFRVDKEHNHEQIASGRLSITYKEGKYSISVDDTSFELGSIINMTMVLSNRIVFSDDDGYYEINSGGTNLRKYVLAREIALD